MEAKDKKENGRKKKKEEKKQSKKWIGHSYIGISAHYRLVPVTIGYKCLQVTKIASIHQARSSPVDEKKLFFAPNLLCCLGL